MTNQELTAAYLGCVDLLKLYNAYRATSKANLVVMEKVRKNIQYSGKEIDNDDLSTYAWTKEYEALSLKNDLVFKIRTEQISQRIEELKEKIS